MAFKNKSFRREGKPEAGLGLEFQLYQGCMAPKRTSQARIDLATRLRTM
jgi:hypothetical protein